MQDLSMLFTASFLFIIITGALVCTILLINNLFHRFWKPVKLMIYQNPKDSEN